MDRAQMKEQAKSILGASIFCNNWLMVLVVLLVQTAALSIAGSILSGVGSLIIMGPLAVGVSIVLLKLVRSREKVEFESILKGFNEGFGQNLGLGIMTGLFVALWSLLFVIPGIIKAYAYSMAFYVRADHPEYNWKQCLQESMRITDGHKMELFVLDLSFIGWYFVGSLCLGIGTLWVAPYHETTKVLYYEAYKNN